MEARSKPDAPKRSQTQHPGGAGLGFQRGETFYRKHWGAALDGQHWCPSIHGERWRAALDRNRRVTSFNRQRRHTTLDVAILTPDLLQQPILVGERV